MRRSAAPFPALARTSRASVIALLLFVALPWSGALAEEEGNLVADAPVGVEGAFETTAHHATSVLLKPGGGGEVTLRLDAPAAYVNYYEGSWYCSVDSCHPTDYMSSGKGFRETLTNVEVTLVTARNEFIAVVGPEPGHYAEAERVPHVARLAGGSALLDAADGNTINPSQPGTTQHPTYRRDEGAFSVQAEGGRLDTTGAHELFLYNAEVRITGVAEDGEPFERTVTTGRNRGGEPFGYGDRVSWLIVQTPAGALTAISEDFAETSAMDLTLLSRDLLLLTNAEGTAETTEDEYVLDGETAELQGEALVRPLEAVEEDGETRLVLSVTPPSALTAGGAAAPAPAPEAARLAAYAAGGAAALGLVGWFWPRIRYLGALMALPLYTRISKGEALEHGKREEIYALIREDPGIHAHEISSRANIGWGTTVYHLNLLENHGLVVSKRDGRYKRFFLAAGPRDAREAQAALRNETSANVARFVQANPGTTQKTLCQQLGIQPSLANWHVKRLEQAGLVKKVREGRLVRYFGGPAWQALDPGPAPAAATVAGEPATSEG